MITGYSPHLAPKLRSPVIMAAAAGMPCTLRIASILGGQCNGPETTVGCHLPVGGKGMGTKVTDLAVVFGCAACHAALDRGFGTLMQRYPVVTVTRLLNAVVETLTLLHDEGIIQVADNRAEVVTSGQWRW